MPDFDPKSIPILDDIIEDNLIEKEKTEHSDEDQQTEQEQDEPQLGTIENIVDGIIDDRLYPETEETAVDTLGAATEDIAEEEMQSALIDYRAEGEDDSASNRAVFIDPADDFAIDDNIIGDSTSDNELSDDTLSDPAITVHALSDHEVTTDLSFTANTGTVSVEPAPAPEQPLKPVIDEITDDIVRQLLPELEQQLRFLVQQALEDRLPDDLVEQLNTEPP